MSIALHYSFRKINYENLCDDNEIPEESVEQVYLKACDLDKFPQWLMRLENLTHLVISANMLQELPQEIENLANLNYLDVNENQIMELPSSIFNLLELKYLDVSGNFIENLPKSIKNLKKLEVLKFDRNFLLEVPPEIVECKELFQISFEECARLFFIPKNIFTLPRLVYASFRKCSLVVVSSIIPSHLCSLSIDGNHLLNCVPQEILKFLSPSQSTSDFYMIEDDQLETLQNARNEFVGNSDINYVKLANGFIANVSYNYKKLFHGDLIGEIPSLQELCMRSIKSCPIPLPHLERIMSSPTALCQCQEKLYTEAHVIFYFEKSRCNTQLIICKFFCSLKCLKLFYDENIEKIIILS